jgi:hypothetical protein
MTVQGSPARFTFSIVGMLTIASVFAITAQAAGEHEHGGPVPGGLVKFVREITTPYKSVSAAEAAGYALTFGCVSGPDAGAMDSITSTCRSCSTGKSIRCSPRSFSTSRLATGRCA